MSSKKPSTAFNPWTEPLVPPPMAKIQSSVVPVPPGVGKVPIDEAFPRTAGLTMSMNFAGIPFGYEGPGPCPICNGTIGMCEHTNAVNLSRLTGLSPRSAERYPPAPDYLAGYLAGPSPRSAERSPVSPPAVKLPDPGSVPVGTIITVGDGAVFSSGKEWLVTDPPMTPPSKDTFRPLAVRDLTPARATAKQSWNETTRPLTTISTPASAEAGIEALRAEHARVLLENVRLTNQVRDLRSNDSEKIKLSVEKEKLRQELRAANNRADELERKNQALLERITFLMNPPNELDRDPSPEELDAFRQGFRAGIMAEVTARAQAMTEKTISFADRAAESVKQEKLVRAGVRVVDMDDE